MNQAAKPFLTSLESVRGLAALSVALFHSYHLVPVDGVRVFDHRLWQLHGATETVLRLIMVPFNGGAAVSLFFVLSGFVLHLSVRRETPLTPPSALRFSARRLLRIYPPLALNLIAIAVTWAICAQVFPDAGFAPFTFEQVADNFALRDTLVNGVTWTLLVEIMAVPCILLTTLAWERWGLRGIIGCTLGFFLVAVTPLNLKFDFVKSWYLFSSGMLVAELFVTGRNLDKRRAQALFALSLASLMLARLLLGHWSKWSVLVEAIASTGLIAALVLGPKGLAHGALSSSASRFLGRVSYSFYLYHPLALMVAFPLLWHSWQGWMEQNPILSSTLLAAVSVPPALLMGLISYRLIERPVIAIGRMI